MITLTEGSVARGLTLPFRMKHEITRLLRFLGLKQLQTSVVAHRHLILIIETLLVNTVFGGLN